MDLKTDIQNDMKAAMKAQDPVKVGALRMLISEIKKREIDKKAPLEVGEIHKAIQSMIKQRLDSIEAFEKASRTELAEKEKTEMNILKGYLPQAMSAAEIERLVAEVITESQSKSPSDLGKVMKLALAKSEGRADGKTVSELAKKILSQQA